MLKEVLDQFYLDRQRDKEQNHFYITDAGKCGRSVFFKFKKAPREEMEARILRMFEHGDSIHQLIMRPLIATREVHVVASEVDIRSNELVSGRADAIISNGEELFVLDIKSMNSMIFRKLTAPKEENVYQIQMYLHFFKIPKGILLYVNKDSLELKEFVIDYNKKTAENLLESLKDLKVKIKENIIPERILDYPDNWQCRYCQFREICSLAGGGDIDWEIFEKKIEKVS
ncbi:MAG: PD-(D/E)XK nuclease family protein [Candidatus Parcubacteria bacterium]|nr:PD-(D/E)XK nuclease family protein [Candidatus Parcubacteria bacterium]